jgi:hypothetical protein
MKKSVKTKEAKENPTFAHNAVNDMERKDYFNTFNLELLNRIRSIKNQRVDICQISTTR